MNLFFALGIVLILIGVGLLIFTLVEYIRLATGEQTALKIALYLAYKRSMQIQFGAGLALLAGGSGLIYYSYSRKA